MIQNAHLVFVPSIGLSDVIPTVELAKRLLKLNPLFSVTFLVIPGSNRGPIESITNSAPSSIRFILLPPADLPPPSTEPGIPFFSIYIQNHQPLIKQHLTHLISNDSPEPSHVRLILNMFSSTLVDVAKQLSIPSYHFFTPPASVLGLMLHLPALDSLIKSEFRDHSPELTLPSYINPVPTISFPSFLNKKTDTYRWFLTHCKNIASSDAIIVNSAPDLEFCAFNHMAGKVPPVYFSGPILNLDGNASFGSGTDAQSDRIMNWLDKQPVASVVFLCFGTRGALTAPQIIEMATGLERSGQRFLWSIHCPPDDYSNLEEVMPHGFVDRVGERGLLCGWAPQVKILGHKGVGAFVTHCGWNSILESVWFGVPMLTWPLYAEQKLNAFEVVVDLGIAAELKREGVEVVPAVEVERSVRGIIEGESDVRKNVKQMSEKCHIAVIEGGSSWNSLKGLIHDFTAESCKSLMS